MKILILLLCGVALSEQYFWFEKSSENTDEKPEPRTTGENDNRFILNILKYKVENGTESEPELSCLGVLIASDYALAPADCVKLPSPYRIAVQFVINEEGTNNVGPSIVLKRTELIVHDKYNASYIDTNNIALVKFYPQGIVVHPPIFEHFYPIERTSLPQLNFCSVLGRLTHLSKPPEETILVNGPGCCGTNQAYCTVFPDKNHGSCNSQHGAPVVCNNLLAGFLLSKSSVCVEVSGRTMMRYHSVGDFKKWIDYYVENLHTDAPTTTTPSSASFMKLSISLMVFMISFVALK